MAGAALLALLVGVTAVHVSNSMALDMHSIGFHQGARRLVACASGVVKGLELTTEMLPTFADPVIASLRLICEGGKITIDKEAPQEDKLHFGAFHANTKLQGSCPSDHPRLAGLKWRFAHQSTNCEKRAAGVTLVCIGADGTTEKEVRLDSVSENPTTQHQFHVVCPSKSTITGFNVWYNHWEFNGFEVASCST